MAVGHVTALFLFDVGDSIDRARVRGQIEATGDARLSTKRGTPTYLQYQEPSLTIDGQAIGVPDVAVFVCV
jgi:hypothetical protein